LGSGRCQNLIRVASAGATLCVASGKARRGLIETLRCGSTRRVIVQGRPSTREEFRVQPEPSSRSQTLERRNPWEAPVIAGLNPRAVARQSRQAWTWKPRLDEPIRHSCAGRYLRVERQAGSSRLKSPDSCGRGNLRRVNPMSAAGAKKNRHGIRGSKPPRG
jgi:hypothetical protein